MLQEERLSSPTGLPTRLVAWLWFFTTALAAAAVLLRYAKNGEIAWYLVAAGAFTLVMGIATWKRSGAPGA